MFVFIDHVSKNLQLAREASDDHHPPGRGVNIEDEAWTFELWGWGVNFEEGYRVRYLQDDFSRTISSEITDCVLLLSINMCHKGKPCPEKEKQNNMTCSCSWHDMFKDIWTEIGSPMIQCIKWLYPVNVFYATCPVLWRDRSYSQVLLGTLDVLWSGYICVGGARAVGGMVWEAGIRSGVTVVTFGMCEIQDWNLKLWKLFYLKVVKLWIRNLFCTNWLKIGWLV